MKRVEERVRKIIAEQFDVEEKKVPLCSGFMEQLADERDPDAWVNGIEVIMEVEKEFGIRIPDKVAENLQTLRDIVRYLEELTPEKLAQAQEDFKWHQCEAEELNKFIKEHPASMPAPPKKRGRRKLR